MQRSQHATDVHVYSTSCTLMLVCMAYCCHAAVAPQEDGAATKSQCPRRQRHAASSGMSCAHGHASARERAHLRPLREVCGVASHGLRDLRDELGRVLLRAVFPPRSNSEVGRGGDRLWGQPDFSEFSQHDNLR